VCDDAEALECVAWLLIRDGMVLAERRKLDAAERGET
jgi:hypothetical protein